MPIHATAADLRATAEMEMSLGSGVINSTPKGSMYQALLPLLNPKYVLFGTILGGS